MNKDKIDNLAVVLEERIREVVSTFIGRVNNGYTKNEMKYKIITQVEAALIDMLLNKEECATGDDK